MEFVYRGAVRRSPEKGLGRMLNVPALGGQVLVYIHRHNDAAAIVFKIAVGEAQVEATDGVAYEGMPRPHKNLMAA